MKILGNITATSGAFNDGLTVNAKKVSPGPSLYNLGEVGSGSKIIDWSNGSMQKLVLTGDPTFTFSNGENGGVYILAVEQDSSGVHTVTWDADTRWAYNSPPTLTLTANHTDYFGFIYNGDGDGKYDGFTMGQSYNT